MGFGLLFSGYLILINFVYPGFTNIFAYLLMFAGIINLSVYNSGFKHAKLVLYPLIAFGFAALVLEAIGFLGYESNILESINYWLNIITMVFELVFNYFLLTGIEDIAAETGLPKLAQRAVSYIFTGGVYYILSFISMINIPAINEMNRYFMLPLLLFGLVWMVLNAALIYSCYMWICLEGEEEMAVKPSKIGFVNRFRAELDEKEKAGLEKQRRLNEEKLKKRQLKKRK